MISSQSHPRINSEVEGQEIRFDIGMTNHMLGADIQEVYSSRNIDGDDDLVVAMDKAVGPSSRDMIQESSSLKVVFSAAKYIQALPNTNDELDMLASHRNVNEFN